MKKQYICPETTMLRTTVREQLLSASIQPDGKATSWGAAETDEAGVEIHVKSNQEQGDFWSEEAQW